MNDSSDTPHADRKLIRQPALPPVVPAQPIPIDGHTPHPGGKIRLIRENDVVRIIEYQCPCGHLAHITCHYD